MNPEEYQLALDEQVTNYLDIRHKHTYFLITAAIVVLAFVINFASTNNLLSSLDLIALSLISIGTLTSLSVAAFSLWSLKYDNDSHELHLKYSHEKKDWNNLTPDQQEDWEKINKNARILRNLALIMLTIAVSFNTIFLSYQLYPQGRNRMHHYGEDSTDIIPNQDHFEIIFTNKETGQKIRMIIPRVGSKENADKGLTMNDVREISGEVRNILREKLR